MQTQEEESCYCCASDAAAAAADHEVESETSSHAEWALEHPTGAPLRAESRGQVATETATARTAAHALDSTTSNRFLADSVDQGLQLGRQPEDRCRGREAARRGAGARSECGDSDSAWLLRIQLRSPLQKNCARCCLAWLAV
jgi:hypothetical protein